MPTRKPFPYSPVVADLRALLRAENGIHDVAHLPLLALRAHPALQGDSADFPERLSAFVGALIERLAVSAAMKTALSWHFGFPSESHNLQAIGRRDQALKAVSYDRDAYMKERWDGETWRKSRQTRALCDLERQLDREGVRGQPATAKEPVEDGSEFEYEVEDRALSCIVSLQDHRDVTYRSRLNLHCLGRRVRLFQAAYRRSVTGMPPSPRVLSVGHYLLTPGPIREEPRTMLDVPHYASFIYLGRAHGPGDRVTVDYDITFRDATPPDPSFSIRNRSHHGRLDFTVVLPTSYASAGIAFNVCRDGTNTPENPVVWLPDKGLVGPVTSQSVEVAGERIDIDWDIDSVEYGALYEIRWTNESISSLYEGLRP